MNTENTARVDAYLDQVLAPLARRLSAFHQQELRRELRTHLWERIDAYQELGHTENEAVTEALKQFGGADDFLRQWRREWQTMNRSDALKEVLTAAQPALRLSLLALSLNLGVMALFDFLTFRSPLGGPFLDAVFYGLILASLLVSPAALGIAQGRHTPRRPGSGMFAALSIEIACVTGLYCITSGLDGTKLFGGLFSLFGGLFSSLPLIIAVWMPTACASAAVSGWWTQKSRARQIA